MKCLRCNFNAEPLESRCPKCDYQFEETVEKKSKIGLLISKVKKTKEAPKPKKENKFEDIANAISVKASVSETVKNISGSHPIITKELIDKELESSSKIEEKNKIETKAKIENKAKESNLEESKLEEGNLDHNKKDYLLSILKEAALEEVALVEEKEKDFNVESLISITKEIDAKIPEETAIDAATKDTSDKTSNKVEKDAKLENITDIETTAKEDDFEESIENLISSIPEIKLDSAEEEEEEEERKKKENQAKEKAPQLEPSTYEPDMDKELDLDSLLKEFE